MTKFFSRSLIPTVALAGLAGTFLASAEPAEAKSNCLARYHACDQRCARSYDHAGWVRCHYRTCGPQYDQCVGGGGKRGLVASIKQPGPVAQGPQSPRGPVNSGPFVPSGRNPTGGIVPDGMPKTGGIVPSGMPQNGGIVPSGPVRMFSQGKR